MDLSECYRISTSKELLACTLAEADFYDDDHSKDKLASAARAPPPSSSSPVDVVSPYLKTKFVCLTASSLPIDSDALFDAPSSKTLCLEEESIEPPTLANRLSPPPHQSFVALMTDWRPPPVASQVNASMPPPLDLRCNLEVVEPVPLKYCLNSQRGTTPVGASVDASRPRRIDDLHCELMQPLSKRFPPPATQLSSATEFTSRLYPSTPVYAELPHPPRLASQPIMSMIPRPAPCLVRARQDRPAAPIVCDQPTMYAPPSPAPSGGFGGFLRSTNEPLGFGSSASGLFGAAPQQQQQAQQIVRQQLPMRFSEA
ncbi:hypothetical protein M9458_019792, partial [Cirrhinus mrigala]